MDFLPIFLFSQLHLFLITITCFASSMQPLCHNDDSIALLEFKNSFFIDKFASRSPFAYPKVLSWRLEESRDCCSWDGVECDHDSGRVVALDLSSSFLYGSTNSTRGLFNLSQLQRLDLADNDFNFSQIPSAVGHLPRLTYLNLSHSAFSGQVPYEISRLSNLSFLDLSYNDLELKSPSLSSVVRNLSNLKQLHLNYVDISTTVPGFLANFSSLTSLLLRDCRLHGEFPNRIFQLPNLQFLNIRNNFQLTGYLPEFHSNSSLKELLLWNTSFLGKIPSSIEKLDFLHKLDFGACRFSGLVPSSLGKLTRLTYLDISRNNFEGQISFFLHNLTQLTQLRLGENQFTGEIPSWLGNFDLLTHLILGTNRLHGLVPSSLGRLTSLTHLDLSMNNFTGQIPCFLRNLTKLTKLNLGSNEFSGHIPFFLGNLTQLTSLVLENNTFHGFVPYSFTKLTNIISLSLRDNELSGTLNFDMFLGLNNLEKLFLSRNMLSILVQASKKNATVPRFRGLGLSSCNLTKFPDFLRYQDRLVLLVLYGNNINGQIPKWIWNISTQTMSFVDISNNFLTGFEQPPGFIPWVKLVVLDLSSNKLIGHLPISPPSTIEYIVSNNKLSGEISPFFCNISSLLLFDLSNNQLSGMLPHCFENLSKNLVVLNMSDNHFHGSIPQMCAGGSNVRMIDLSYNQFQGHLPQTLANCMMLEFLNLGNNQLNDVFPSWLGTLPKLRLLILRSNNLHGVIRKHNGNPEFSSLRVFDLSNNSFTGKLSYEFFKNLKAMRVTDAGNSSYLVANLSFAAEAVIWSNDFAYSITITNKGRVMLYEKIQEVFAVIDLSSNRFEGSIPQSLGILQGLHALNLSNNILSGNIPSSLGNITELESLDLSNNKLSGQIPPQLGQLTFLGVFKVSHNHLRGPIPQLNQLKTFDINSYEGNLGLCGNPLPEKCESSVPPSGFEEEQDSESALEFQWMTIVPGYVSGLVIGVVIGQTFATKKHDWFVKTFGQGKLKGRRVKRGRQRS